MEEKQQPKNNNGIIVILLILMFLMYGYFQEERYNELNDRVQKIEQYTNYLF